MAKSCRALHTIASGLLQQYKNSHPFHAGAVPYLRAIDRNPELGRREPNFTMSAAFQTGKLEEGDLALLETIPEVLNPPPPRSRSGAFEDFILGQRWAIVAKTIISRLPCISSITLCTPKTTGRFNFHSFSFSIDTLRHVKLVGFVDRSTFPVVDVSLDPRTTLFDIVSRSRNVDAVEVEYMRGLEDPGHIILLSRIRSLCLRGCYLDPRNLSHITSGCSDRLEEFIFHAPFYEAYLGLKCRWWYQAEKDFKGEAMAWHIVDIMSQGQKRTSLKTLEICTRELRQGECHGVLQRAVLRLIPTNSYSAFCTKMKSFTSLRTLRISQHAIWEDWQNQTHAWGPEDKMSLMSKEAPEPTTSTTRLVSLLPHSVESFSLYDVTAEFFPNLITLGHNIKTHKDLPNLKEVYLYPKPDLCRRLIHARAHQADKELADHDCYSRSCKVDNNLLAMQTKMMQALEDAGLKANFSSEAYPVFTDKKEDLQRQRDLQHWCRRCHYDDDAYAVQPTCGEVPSQLSYDLPDPELPPGLENYRRNIMIG
ncbi:hypothetical protein GGS26DRAFT_602707 [Hypomontagnella submonticulosa]|nr:hypothetical protein GGS26DRAFT_602707 [Hypomontagnella submonticulosa]